MGAETKVCEVCGWDNWDEHGNCNACADIELFHIDDDADDFDDDPNRCPDCGGDLTAEGFCPMMDCGYSINDDIMFDDDESEAS
jgi:hypothetical protein